MRARVAVGMTVVILVIVGGVCLQPCLEAGRRQAQQAGCQVNLKQVSMGMRMYTADYEERFPPAERWTAGVDPYLRNPFLYICPARPRLRCGYAMDGHLSLLPVRAIAHPERTAVLFESTVGIPNASGSFRSVASAHPGGAWHAYVDGHLELVPRSR